MPLTRQSNPVNGWLSTAKGFHMKKSVGSQIIKVQWRWCAEFQADASWVGDDPGIEPSS